MQKGPQDSKNICGKPGVNGGFFKNDKLKFGVNCYGYKPDADPNKLVNTDNAKIDTRVNVRRRDLLNKYKQMSEEGKLDVRPFSNTKWSKYSFKKSSYIITPDYTPTPTLKAAPTPIVVESEIPEDDKDPNKFDPPDEGPSVFAESD